MVSDTVLAVAILVASAISTYWFVRWDMWMEKRHKAKVDAEIDEILRNRSND